jgi:hypothetical protein
MKYGIITVFLVLFCTMTIPAHAFYADGCSSPAIDCPITVEDVPGVSKTAHCATCTVTDNKNKVYTGKHCGDPNKIDDQKIRGRANEIAMKNCKAGNKVPRTIVPNTKF